MKRFGLVLAALLLAACPGLADYSEEIGQTGYIETRTDSETHFVSPPAGCGPTCPSVSPNVEAIRWNENAIAVRRRVVNYFWCEEGYITRVDLNKYEQYVIILATHTSVGPMSVTEYESFQRNNKALMERIDLLDKTNRFDGQGEVLFDGGRCTNPKPN